MNSEDETEGRKYAKLTLSNGETVEGEVVGGDTPGQVTLSDGRVIAIADIAEANISLD
jgi:hypothetical protein